MKKLTGTNGVPYVVTHDARTIRFVQGNTNVGDSIKLNIETGEILGTFHRKVGNLVIVTNGRNKGRVGTIHNIVQKPGKIHIVSIHDAQGHTFSTRLSNIFVIGKGKVPSITLPKDLGLKLSIIERAEANQADEESEEED